MSAVVPLYPPDGWCIMTVAWGNAYLLPGVPAARSKDPIELACPRTMVDTGAVMYCMVSYIERPADTEPPGELMYMEMGASLSLSKNRREAVMVAACKRMSVLSSSENVGQISLSSLSLKPLSQASLERDCRASGLGLGAHHSIFNWTVNADQPLF